MVVNTHLYGLDLESRGVILPEHDIVVIDEAHQLEDIISDTFGLEIGASRFTNLARAVRSVVEEPTLVDDVDGSGALLASTLVDHVGRRLRTLDPDLVSVLTLARDRLDRVMSALRAVADKDIGDLTSRKARAMQLTGSLQIDLAAALAIPDTSVAWVEGPEDRPALRVAPIDVAEVLRETLWTRPTVVLTSATIPPLLGQRLGLIGDDHVEMDVGSPFDYEHQALLYCAAHLPDPREASFESAMHDELEALIRAAGGRTLALFTSWRAMDAAAEALCRRLDTPVLTQRDLPKPALVAAFTVDESASLFATMGFWQGIDVPGRTLSLVAIDRLPFPRPDDPLLQARRERAKADAFRLVDLSRAATMLAQGAGRLIRSHDDRGVVAVLDPRLAKTKAYRWEIIGALPRCAVPATEVRPKRSCETCTLVRRRRYREPMARLDQRDPRNADGAWFVDTRCIDCDTCRELVPDMFDDAGGQSVVLRQPTDPARSAGRGWRPKPARPSRSAARPGRPDRPGCTRSPWTARCPISGTRRRIPSVLTATSSNAPRVASWSTPLVSPGGWSSRSRRRVASPTSC